MADKEVLHHESTHPLQNEGEVGSSKPTEQEKADELIHKWKLAGYLTERTAHSLGGEKQKPWEVIALLQRRPDIIMKLEVELKLLSGIRFTNQFDTTAACKPLPTEPNALLALKEDGIDVDQAALARRIQDTLLAGLKNILLDDAIQHMIEHAADTSQVLSIKKVAEQIKAAPADRTDHRNQHNVFAPDERLLYGKGFSLEQVTESAPYLRWPSFHTIARRVMQPDRVHILYTKATE